ncbi:MAG: zeta toxin family protein [Chitinophagaceae bacterium]|nr:zeta toxin family protein [Chitinophagaceae bacterium]
MPVLFIITGPNGAGKSTVGYTYLPENIHRNYTVFDGDKLALQKRKELLLQIRSIKEARKAADEWVQKQFKQEMAAAIKANDHFAYEGHFRDKRTLNTPRKFRKKGYTVSLIFMGLADPDLSELRVIDRAKHGGHNVPLYEIQSNFYGNLVMLNNNYRLFDEMLVVDTSKSFQHQVLLHLRNSNVLFYTPEKHLPVWFSKFLPRLLQLIKKEEKTSTKKK